MLHSRIPAGLFVFSTACSGNLQPTLSSTDVENVCRVSWDAGDIVDSRLVWEIVDTEGELQQWSAPAFEHDGLDSALILGVPQDATVTWWVEADGRTTQAETFTSNPIDSEITLADESSGAFDDFTYTALQPLDGTWVPVVLDAKGRPVWSFADPKTAGQVTLRVIPDPSGQGVWLNRFADLTGASYSGTPSIMRVDWDGKVMRRISLPDHHHDFYLHDDGSLAWLEYDDVEVESDAGELVEVRGDRLVVQDPDGNREILWSSWDSFDYDPESIAATASSVWSHANTIEFDGEAYVVSVRNHDALVRVLPDGDVDWIMGDGRTVQPEPVFGGQHGVTVDDGAILLFDNSSGHVVEYEVDADAGMATQTWAYEPEETRISPALGHVKRLDDDTVRVIFGSHGVIEQVGDDGSVQAAARWSLLSFLGYARYATALGSNEAL